MNAAVMLALLLASTRSVCVHPPGADEILDAFRKAAEPTVSTRYMTAHYSYGGQGLRGTAEMLVDLRDGRYIEKTDAPPNTTAAGYDGQLSWRTDLSGFSLPQEGGDKPALARNEAYRNANGWWKPGHGGAAIEVAGCDTLRITPNGGKPFDATFDPVTHVLRSIHEDQSFGVVTTTEYSAYERQQGRMMATVISTLTNEDPASRETIRLSSVTFSDNPSTSFEMPATLAAHWSLPRTGRVTLPFRLSNNHIVVPVRINGRGPFPFLVDTGGHDIITPATVKQLGLVSQGDSPSFGAGDKAGSNGYAHVATMDAGGAVLRDQTVLTLDFSPKDVEGIQLGGMLGVEFIERFVVRIDYGAKTLTFIEPHRFSDAERRASGAFVPILFYDHMPQVSGQLDGRPVRLDIDTGSRAEVTVTSPFVRKAQLLPAYPGGVVLTDGWGVGGASHSYIVRIGSLSLGPVEVHDAIAGFSSASVGAFADSGSDGNVGSGLLKQFVATFDYSNRMLYLNRLAHPDADTGRFDRVGIWVNQASAGAQVMDVASGSPADQAELKVGDIITHIDGHSVSARALSDIRRDLKLVPVGAPLRFDYLRHGRAGAAIVRPRNLIPDEATAH